MNYKYSVIVKMFESGLARVKSSEI